MMESLVQLWNTILPTVTFAAIIGVVWKASSYCTTVNNKLSYLKAAVVKIEKHLFKESFIETLSPISLNENGIDIAKNIKAHQIVKRLSEEIVLDDNINAYEIQEICFAYANNKLFEALNDDERDIMENYAFNRGHKIESYGSIFGVLLRDIWLERRGIPTGEIDIHAPSHSVEKPA